MANNLVGKWKMVESENFEEYMKEVGVGLLTRKAAANLKPSVEIRVEGKHWVLLQTSTLKNHTTEFDLDTEFDETTPDGRVVRTIVHLEGDKLVQKQTKIKSNDKDSVITRYVEDGKLYVVCTSGNVTSKRVYVRE